jgi:hypothetical protein
MGCLEASRDWELLFMVRFVVQGIECVMPSGAGNGTFVNGKGATA